MRTNEEIIRNSLMALGFTLSAGLWSWSIVPALAADFYILNVTDENNVSLLDPTTIIPAQAGHKAFHLAQIDEFDLWIDNNVEVDCAGKRSRKLSAISHLASGTTIQGLSSPGPWNKLAKGTVGLRIHDVVCQWPNSKPTGSSVYVATDFKSAVSRISRRIYEFESAEEEVIQL